MNNAVYVHVQDSQLTATLFADKSPTDTSDFLTLEFSDEKLRSSISLMFWSTAAAQNCLSSLQAAVNKLMEERCK